MSILSRPPFAQRFVGNFAAAWLLLVGWLGLMLKRWSRGSNSIATLSANPRVSVLIPTHNRVELLLTRSLPSVLGQTHQNLEVIVCVHGCTDGTEIAIRRLGDPRVKTVLVPRESLGYPESAENHWLVGPVRPLNAGTEVATGEVIALLGDDDQWLPNHLEQSLAMMRECDAEWVSGWSTDIDSSGTVRTNKGSDEGGEIVGPVATWVYRAYLKHAKWNINSWRKGWNRPNDIDLGNRFLKMGVRHVQVERAGAIWEARPGETSMGSAAYVENQTEMIAHFAIKPKRP